jgi:hypothetical protein
MQLKQFLTSKPAIFGLGIISTIGIVGGGALTYAASNNISIQNLTGVNSVLNNHEQRIDNLEAKAGSSSSSSVSSASSSSSSSSSVASSAASSSVSSVVVKTNTSASSSSVSSVNSIASSSSSSSTISMTDTIRFRLHQLDRNTQYVTNPKVYLNGEYRPLPGTNNPKNYTSFAFFNGKFWGAYELNDPQAHTVHYTYDITGQALLDYLNNL